MNAFNFTNEETFHAYCWFEARPKEVDALIEEAEKGVITDPDYDRDAEGSFVLRKHLIWQLRTAIGVLTQGLSCGTAPIDEDPSGYCLPWPVGLTCDPAVPQHVENADGFKLPILSLGLARIRVGILAEKLLADRGRWRPDIASKGFNSR